MGALIHSKFNPATIPPAALERLLVQRRKVADHLVEVFREGAEPVASRHHVLIVGPRGIGKSHLIAVVVNRLKADESLHEKLAIAWLPEDEWAISNFNDFLREILRVLGGDVSRLHKVPLDEIERRAWNFIEQQLAGRRLLVVVENLDEILDNFGVAGQRKWRALVQNTGIWSILAGACSLSLDFKSYEAPFYGFFAVTQLDNLSSDEAIDLMCRMAELQGDAPIGEELQTAEGRAKVRCVHHLAGGNPRVFVTFYQMLAEGVGGDLMTPLLKLIDAMTPYYQSQMRSMSPQQRKIVDLLCRSRGPVNVKAVAEGCGITQQTASSQLGQLLDRRFVTVQRLGRKSEYELGEPLMRICVEVKGQNAGMLPLAVEFARLWYTEEELSLVGPPASSPHEDYRTAARTKLLDSAVAEELTGALRPILSTLGGDNEEWPQVVRRIVPDALLSRACNEADRLRLQRILIALLESYEKNSRAAAEDSAMSASV